MRASCEALRQQISLSKKAVSQQRRLPAKAISAIIFVTAIGLPLHQSAQRDPEMPEFGVQAVAGKDPDSFVPSLGSNSMADRPAETAPAERSQSNDAALRTVPDATAPTPASTDGSPNAMAIKPKGPAIINGAIAAAVEPNLLGNLGAAIPNSAAAANGSSKAISTESKDPMVINQAIAAPFASNLFSNPAAAIPNSEADTNPSTEHKVVAAPVSAAERAKEILAIRRAKLIEDRQEWRYCLAPSYAERKVYVSSPIPSSAISESAEAAFDRTLRKDDIAHDEVQCPRAPNRPTLLFRQRDAVRWNQDNGNTIVTLAWQPDIERANADLTSSQPLVISSTALTIR